MATKIADGMLQTAREEAVRQLVNRERRDGLRALHDHLWRALAWRIDMDGPVEQLASLDDESQRLRDEEQRVLDDLDAYDRPGDAADHPHYGERRCALVGEDLDHAIRRILLERGASTYQIALTLDGVEPANVGASKERKAADRTKDRRLTKLQGEVADLERRIEANRRWSQVPLSTESTRLMIRTWGSDAVERYRARNAAFLRQLEARRDELQAAIDRLSLDRKSSSGKRS